MERDGERSGLGVVEQQHRVAARAAEPVAAVDAAIRVHRVPELAEPFDVAAERPLRDLEAGGEIRSGPVAAALQERQQPQGPRGGVCHVRSLAAIADGNWPERVPGSPS